MEVFWTWVGQLVLEETAHVMDLGRWQGSIKQHAKPRYRCCHLVTTNFVPFVVYI